MEKRDTFHRSDQRIMERLLMSTIPAGRPRPFVLVILDGWGINPRKEGNAIALARTPNIDRLAREWPHTAVRTSGEAVGLPEGQMGNSEVGHQNIGAGKRVLQDYTRVSESIRDGSHVCKLCRSPRYRLLGGLLLVDAPHFTATKRNASRVAASDPKHRSGLERGT